MEKVISKRIMLDWIPEDMYEIYSTGEVVELEHDRIISTSINGNGYSYISLRDISESKRSYRSVSVHRLLALQFIPKEDIDISLNRNFVHFKDFDKTNIRISNLEWLNSFELSLKTQLKYDEICNIEDCLPYICKCLEHKYEPKTICELIGLDIKKYSLIIGRIYRRQIFKNFTKHYIF